MAYIYQNRKWEKSIRECCIARQGIVASKHPLIGKTGIDILKKGGNAVDAAVAAAFADCVVEPAMNGIGGEGVMAIHMANGTSVIIDYVGRPPKDCIPSTYKLLDEIEPGWMGWRRVEDDANMIGYKAATVPGTVAGLAKALDLYGTMELKDVIKPAIEIAEEGFTVGWWTASHIYRTMNIFAKFPEWRKIFLKDGKNPLSPSTYFLRQNVNTLVNKDLAESLTLISKYGPDSFYKGEIAEKIVQDMRKNDGLITLDDLAMYEPIVTDPVPGTYRGYKVIYDPSHAGTTLMEILNILEGFNLNGYGYGSLEHLHIVAEAIGLAYADRFTYMGDPEFVKVPQSGLVSKEYAQELQSKINFEKALKISPHDPWPYEHSTTALTIADNERNLVAINQTLVNAFGCGVVIPGTGIVLNNAMYGLNPEPGHANSISGRKRRIQNVCPTILLEKNRPYIAIGAPGGRAIQTSIAQTIIHVIDFGMDIQSAIEAPRITREIEEIQVDNRFSKRVAEKLEKLGHRIAYLNKEMGNWARPVGILVDKEKNLLYGGVEWHFLGFESEAIGY
ncbi:MAG: gamma-glutamyltransferase [Candidatus Bathyarchaeota archaeon]|nr:MAG: gamma-glutamyltransferase [Candidatus Bathyarchaeota archaeon]